MFDDDRYFDVFVEYAKAGPNDILIRLSIPATGQRVVTLRLSNEELTDPFGDFVKIFGRCQREADAFYAGIQKDIADDDAQRIQRQAFAGLIWGKQFYHYDVREWLEGDPSQPAPPTSRLSGRNHDWDHLHNAEVISMPDTWEYPWYLRLKHVVLADVGSRTFGPKPSM